MLRLVLLLMNTLSTLAATTRERSRDERGDVPGWVLITLMSAGLVAVLWVLAEGALTDLFSSAMETVLSR